MRKGAARSARLKSKVTEQEKNCQNQQNMNEPAQGVGSGDSQ